MYSDKNKMYSDKTYESSSTKQGKSTVEKKLYFIRSTIQKAMKQIKQQSSSCRSLSFIKRISLDLNFQNIQKMLHDLEKGYIVYKHSPNTNQPHNKFLYISGDHRFLCWKSFQKEDEKMIQLRKIQNIIKDDVKVLLQSSTVKNYQKTIIINSQVRSLQVEFNSKQQKQKFCLQLDLALRNSKRMHLSYRF